MEKENLKMDNRFSTVIAAMFILGAIGGTAHAQNSENTIEPNQTNGDEPAIQDPGPDVHPAPDAISAFVRRIFQDKSWDLWFGTNGDGVVRYNGDSLEYFSLKEGFGGLAVRGIVGDKEGTVRFATHHNGVCRFDGESLVPITKNGPWR